MSSRPRSLRATRLSSKRPVRPRLEGLEARLVLSQQLSANPQFLIFNPVGGTASLAHMATVDGIPGPYASSLTPSEIQSFYGTNSIFFNALKGKIQGDGAGQTIAIVDAYDDPNLIDTGAAGFSTSDLAMFDKYFGLPDPPSFTKYSESGSTTSLPPKSAVGGWSVEESLDVEWAHVIAPQANIDLIEATTQIFQIDMIPAVKEAASLPGVSVVSMSFGYPELPTSQTYNNDFVTPAGHQGVTFVAATSDTGSFGTGGIDPFSGQPAFLPNVVSVGGTSLDQQTGFPTLETSWNQGGGGVSQYIKEPSYQKAVQNTGMRTAPDVSADADPNFGGVAVYDSYDFGFNNPWNQIGGTSLATPMWAAMIAIANQGRASLGADTLDGTAAGPQQSLQALYSVPYSDFNDIVGGGNEGPVAKPGYDLASGLGSPKANLLVPDLAAYGLSGQAAVTTNVVNVTVQPPQSVEPGSTFGFAAAVQDAYGNTDISFQGQAVVTSSLTGSVVATANVVNGVAVIDGLTLGSGKSSTYTVTITGNGFSQQGTTSGVTAGSTPSLTLYPAPSFASLKAALQAAASSAATDITIVLEPGTYQLSNTSAASLLIENTGTSSAKTITIKGAGENQTYIVPIIPQGWTSSILSVLGTPNGPVSVNIEGLTIEDGLASNGGIAGKNAGVGGAILIDGGNVMLSNVGLVNDRAVGQVGLTPVHAPRRQAGYKGGAGTPAAGGALYMAGGTLTLNSVSFIGDLARGGRGGTGGVGGTDGGRGGVGGTGGSASGGAAYIAGGTVTGKSNVFQSDVAVGGSGGYGGQGGLGGTPSGLGRGGAGGHAGMGLGGGLFVGGGKVSLTTTPFTKDLARGGIGGSGGLGGFSHPLVVGSFSGFSTGTGVYVGRGGQPAAGADAAGGGMYVGSGSLTLSGSEPNALQNDRALGGFEGFAGNYRFSLSAPFSGHGALMQRKFVPVTGLHYGGTSQPATNGRQATSQRRVGLPGGKQAGHDGHSASSTSGIFKIHVGYGDGGGIYVNSGSVKLINQVVSNDLADYGAGIFNNGGTLTASGLTMGTDRAEIGGAAVNKGTLNIYGGALNADKASHSGNGFTANSLKLLGGKGSTGGAIANYGNLGLGSVAISGATAKLGGAIYSQSGSIQASHLTLSGNTASTRGGGIYSLQGSLTISGGEISNNVVHGTGSSPSVAVGSGGGIDVQGGKVTITGVTLQGNSARAGGGLYLGAGAATITASSFENNFARQTGGAILGNGTLTIKQGTMTGNTAGEAGGGVDAFGQLTMDFVTLTGNSAGTNGGALNIGYKATLDGLTITGNSAVAVGGGINNGGTVTLVASTIGANTASEGGGIYDVGRITMSNADKVAQNVAIRDGGGVYLGSGGRISASGTAAGTAGLSVTGNSVVAGDGGGIFDQHGALTIKYGEIRANAAPAGTKSTMGWGGGLFDSGGRVTLSNTPVQSNLAVDGAGMFITAGSVTLSNEAVTANTAAKAGGGVMNQGILTLSSATMTMNVAQGQGGGIEDQGKLTIINSTLSQNTAATGPGGNLDINVGGQAGITQSTLEYGHADNGGNIATGGVLTVGTSTISFGSAAVRGGGIENVAGGTVVMSNTTVADNTSVGNGGGIDSSATLKLVNDTVAYNQILGLSTGSGLDVESGTAALYNTIVDANSSTFGADLAGNIAPASSNNLFGSVSGALPVGGSNLSSVSQPLLDALKSNGGPTQTIALLAGSPAIDAGSTALAIDPVTNRPLKTDQRGALRGALGINAGSAVDIGAYEASSSYLVTSPVDSAILAGTLRSGVQWAGGSTNANPANLAPNTPAPNTIVFDTSGSFATSQTIDLAATLTLPNDPVGVEILGPGGGVVNIQGNGSFQDISVPGGTAILQGITVGGGSAMNGGGVESAGNLTLNNVILSGNTATEGGGGVYSSKVAGSSLTITGGTIQGNTAGFGAGVVAGNGLNVSGATITGNSAREVGGGIDLPAGGSLNLTSSTLAQNTAASEGGGLYLGYATATVTGGSITGNTAGSGGGLYSAGTGSSLTITGTSFSGNSAVSGGAIQSMTGPVTIAAASLANNTASNTGGALTIGSGAQATVSASTLTANSAGAGGAISNDGSISISASTLSDNSGSTGGAISNLGTLTVIGSTLSGNSAAYGGAIDDTNGGGVGPGDVLTNVTLADNSATTGGGAVYSSLSNITLVNATVAYNSVGSGGAGAGVDAANGSVNLYNTIVDLNAGAPDVAGTIAGSSNMIGVTSPGLASGLAFNGGTTQTIALLAGSPAIDGGIDTIGGVAVPATDQRGAVRGGSSAPSFAYAGASVDIGAYEASSAYQVTTATDTYELGSLRTAVSWANTSTNANPAYLALTTPAPNTVTFTTSGTITLSPSLGALVLSNSTTPVAIFSPAGVAATISGGGATGVLQINPKVTAALTNLTITSGSAATGGGINNAGSLSITGSKVLSSTATGSGGGINNTGTLTLTGTMVTGNSASGVGGGISNAGTLNLANSTIASNTAATGGGGISDPGTLTLTTSQITGNSAEAGGGLSVAGTLTAYATTISGNSAATAGGGLAVQAGGSATLTDLLSVPSTVSGNTAGSANAAGSGGGVDNAGTLVVSYSTITANQSTGTGGGVDNELHGTFTLRYSTLGSNSATTYGGGGLDNSGTATIGVSTIASNQAGTSGGGIGNELGGVLNMTYTTVSANTAASTGGGLYNAATANLSNATIAGNRGSRGGGLYNLGLLTALNDTVAYNSVGAGGLGGGLDAAGGTTDLYNTIVAQNQDGAGAPSDAAGSLAPASVNDLFGSGGSGGLTATTVNDVITGVKKPQLGTLADNGGPTQTIALLANSPALDAGSASIPGIVVPTVDQRGAIRGAAGINAGSNPDIGAYEASSSYLVTTTTDSTDMGTLRSAIAWANVSTNANPTNLAPHAAAPNTAVFDKSKVFSSAQTITIDPTLGPIQMTGTVASGEAIDGTASRGLTISGGGQAQVLSIGDGATAILSGLTISGGSASASGGAITVSKLGTLTINDSTLTGNTAGSGGGAIDSLGTLTIQSSTLVGNSAGLYGGAVDVEKNGTFTATNSTFSGNTSGQGGALYSTGTLTTVNDTIAYNVTTSSTSGGGLNAAGGTSSLYNTIVALNTDSAGTDPADDIAGTVAQASSYNLVGIGGSGGLVNGQNGNQVGVANPGLVAGLGNNGGPTQTIGLTSTSPAIAAAPPTVAGQTISLDQRGALRGSPGTTNIDIGSFELSGSYLVTNATDSTVPGTLRSAIDWANSDTASGSTAPLVIAFDTAPGHTFATPQQIVLGLGTLNLTNTTRPIVIDGPGAVSLTISGNNAVGVLTVAPGVNASIVGVTIADGNSLTGGGILNQGNLSLGTATVGSTAIASGVAFANNTSPSGSGAAVDNSKGTLTVTGSSFTGNSGSYYGGAIFNDDGTATITNSNFVDNSTTYGLGGAIDNLGGTLTVTGSTFQGNTAFQGGVIYNRNDTTAALPATAVLNGVTMTGNSAYQGGALFNEGTMSVVDSTASSNTAFQGGAVSNNFGGTMAITDSTLAANTANQFGGAIDNVSNLTLVADTIAYNVVTPGGSGAGIEAYSGSTAMYDTIAAKNTVGTGTAAAANDITGQLAAGSSYNMVGTGGVANGVNNNILLGTTDPGLAPGLANNGGPTQTIALYTGSPAIGAGSAAVAGVTIPTTDQRGVARPTSGFDIGAFQGSIPAPVTTTPVVVTPASPSLVVTGPVSTTATTASIVSGPSPFGGRHVGRKGHRHEKVQHHALASHARAAAHHHAELARRVVKVQIEKRHR